MSRREISFTVGDTMEDEVYIRYLSFKDEADMKRQIQAKNPKKIDIGAVFSMAPSRHESVKKEAFFPVERELVFDVDLTDYDDIRTCCSGAKICPRCWPFMTVALKVVDRGLREDFGFRQIFWVYSGRRGIHCWVCDKAARALSDEGRTAVVNYFSAVTAGTKENPLGSCHLTWPLHPAMQRALEDLEQMFVEKIAPGASKGGQGYLSDESKELREKILAMLPDLEVPGVELKKAIREAWQTAGSKITPARRWDILKQGVSNAIKALTKTTSDARRYAGKVQDLQKSVPRLVFLLTFPRLDVNVSTHMNHLLKSPFVVHPKTGRVCVPIEPSKCDDFDPFDVPTIAELCQEAAAAGEKASGAAASSSSGAASASSKAAAAAATGGKGTALQPFLDGFERTFLRPMERSAKAAMKRMADSKAAALGSW